MSIFPLKKRTLFVLLLVLLKVATVFAQTTIRVPANAPTIQAAINMAKDGDTVLVAPGTYHENINFDGKAITVTSGATSYSGAASTIIDASNYGPVVVFNEGETLSAKLNGFTIEGGHNDTSGCKSGGGIYIGNSSPTISNDVILDNQNYGISVTGASSPLIQGNDINGNHFLLSSISPSCGNVSSIYRLVGSGAGIGLRNTSHPEIIYNVIENNTLKDGSGNGANSSDSVTGAGIRITGTQSVEIKDNIIRGNVANYDAAIAGTISDMVLGQLDLVQNLIYDNPGSGGNTTQQIYISGTSSAVGAPTLIETNNTIYGGGQLLVFYFGKSSIQNNIFANPYPENSIVDEDRGLVCADPFSSKSPITIGYNDVFFTGTTPYSLCPLDSTNISGQPVLSDPAKGDFHEDQSSPTVAAGYLNAPEMPSADLDSKARTVCGTVDMGAYELRPHPPVTLTSSLNPAPGGSSITFTSNVTGNCNTPTGTITYYDDGSEMGSALLNSSASAALTTSLLVVGQHKITASYPGDFNFDKSTSNTLIETITGDPSTTSLTVAPNPAGAFTPVTLSSSVSSQYGTPTGTVTFTSDGSTLASVPLNGGLATTTISSLGAGSYNLVAHYNANTRFEASTSAVAHEKVIAAASVTSLTMSPNPAAATQPVTMSVHVRAASGISIPKGEVQFYDGSSMIGSAALNTAGDASFTASQLAAGTHTITAHYGGSSNFNPSSATASESVNLIATKLSLAATPNPANTGQTITLTASATASLAGMVPSGQVTFYDGNQSLGTKALNGTGAATFSTDSLAVGTHSLHAVLSSGAYFAGSTSPVISETVQSYNFSLALSKDSVSIPSGGYEQISATVSPVGGFDGTVSLSCSGMPDHTQCAFPDGNSVSLKGGAKTVPLVVNTSDVYGYGQKVSKLTLPGTGNDDFQYLAGVLFPALLLIGIRPKRVAYKWLRVMILFALVGSALLGLESCGSKLPGKTLPGKYSLTVTASSTESPSSQHSATLLLHVTK